MDEEEAVAPPRPPPRPSRATDQERRDVLQRRPTWAALKNIPPFLVTNRPEVARDERGGGRGAATPRLSSIHPCVTGTFFSAA